MIIADQLVLPGIQHAFFTREGGVSEGIYASLNGGVGSHDSADAVRENRAIMASHFGIVPDRLVTVWQVHSPDCLAVDRPWSGERPKADGMATATPGLALGIATADCGPVLFADAARRAAGVDDQGFGHGVSPVKSAVEPVRLFKIQKVMFGQRIGGTEYQKYLRSRQWAGTRALAIHRASAMCEVCSDRDYLEVHHKTYERLGNETHDDLIVLCGSCHAKVHDKPARTAWSRSWGTDWGSRW